MSLSLAGGRDVKAHQAPQQGHQTQECRITVVQHHFYWSGLEPSDLSRKEPFHHLPSSLVSPITPSIHPPRSPRRRCARRPSSPPRTATHRPPRSSLPGCGSARSAACARPDSDEGTVPSRQTMDRSTDLGVRSNEGERRCQCSSGLEAIAKGRDCRSQLLPIIPLGSRLTRTERSFPHSCVCTMGRG